MFLCNQLKNSLRIKKLNAKLIFSAHNKTSISIKINLIQGPKHKYLFHIQNRSIHLNNRLFSNEINVPPQKPKIEESPIRKLLRVKDLVDMFILIFLATGIYIGYKKVKEKNANDKKFNLEWLNIPFLKHKIFTCNSFFLPEFLAKSLSDFKEFKPRKDDIWIVSFPKSGTTWLQEIVYLIVNECDFASAKNESIENRTPFLDYPSPGLKFINNMKSTRIIKTHLPLTFLPDQIENESKVIYIVRNPKDVTVSYFHFVKLSTQAEFTGDFDDFVKLFIDGKVPYGPWWKHVDDYANKKNVHLVFYEDLHEVNKYS